MSASVAADEFATPHFVEVGDARVCYRKAGAGPALVMLHGFPLSGLTWRKIVPRLATRMTCYALDLMGLGDSRSSVETEYTSPGQGEVFRRALAAIGVESYALTGNDTGGWI